mgnify:FL=1
MNRLDARIALITGAASGIGLATARRFAEEGAKVVMADRNENALSSVFASLRGDGHQTVTMDVTDERAWAALAERIDAQFGKLDILVNNAGFGKFASITDTTLEQWRSIIAVNLDSVFLGTKYMMPLLAASGHGAIVNMSSIRGIVAIGRAHG